MTYATEPRTPPPYQKCANCGDSEEDHGEVCGVCRMPVEAHAVHDMGHKYDARPYVACPEMAFGNEFESREAR